MQLRSVLYVSESHVVFSEAEQQIASIAVTSRVNNELAGITGCLVYTGTHFAQLIEGGSSAIGALLLRLQVDSRHHRMKIVADTYRTIRACPEWSMAYSRAPHLSGMIIRIAEGKAGGSDQTVLAAILTQTVRNVLSQLTISSLSTRANPWANT